MAISPAGTHGVKKMLINQLYQKLVSIPLKLLVNSKLLPENPIKELEIDTESPIYYVLQRRSTSSLLILREITRKLKLPSPEIISSQSETIKPGSVFFLQNKQILGFGGKPVKKYQLLLEKLLSQQKEELDTRHQLIPFSIYWGRNPGKEQSLFKIFFTDTESATPVRKLFLFLFQGRNSFARLSRPVKLSAFSTMDIPETNKLTRLTRTLRVHFHRYRQAAMGPLVSNKKQVVTNILASDNVKNAIAREARTKNISADKAQKQAEKYVKEIASSYSYKTVRIMESALTHFWNKIYDGVEVTNSEMVRELATTHEIIYLPCHRSHIDYLLLSYTLYHEGLVPPHIAAGINLNFWPAGPILRGGGAFFLRRSFGGNKLYTSVFNEYIFQLMDRGIPLEFFPEGGRSRTGRLLPPKTGLLAMTIQACLRGVRKPVAFVPVYIGYERMFEGKSYIKELRGAEKKKESFGQLLGIRKTLKQAFGKVYLNFSSPIYLDQYLNEKQPDWHSFKGEVNAKPSWLSPLVSELAQNIMERINTSVTINSVSLIALILLSTERTAIGKKELISQLSFLLHLCQKMPYSTQTTFTNDSPETLIAQSEQLGTIFSVENPMGPIITTDEQTAILMTYYRNNVLHLFITSALIASCFLNQSEMTIKVLKNNLLQLFPFLKKELFIHWNEDEFIRQLDETIKILIDKKMLFRNDELLSRPHESEDSFNLLFLHAQIAKPTLLRYGIILTLLSTHVGRGDINRQVLESRSQQLAQRFAVLHSLNAPEAFDKNLFKNTISVLRENELISVSVNNNMEINSDLLSLRELILDKINLQSKQIMLKTAAWAINYWEEKEIANEE